MKLVLSRKGFDSSSGGVPSPIFADGTMLSLPIPDDGSSLRYEHLIWRDKSSADGESRQSARECGIMGSGSNESKGDRWSCFMLGFDRITFDPNIMGGRACIRGMRVTVSLVLNLVANGMGIEEIVAAYPYLEPEDVRQALQYAAWLAEETVHGLEPAVA